MRAHALLLENIHSSAKAGLDESGADVKALAKGLGEDELIEQLGHLPEPAVLGIRSKTHVTKRVLEAAPHLSAIGAFCIGTDQIDLETARRRGVAVFNAPFSSTRSVAELVLAEVVMLSRKIFPRNKAAHEGKWAKSATGAHEVRGKTLGIIGYGHIGSQLSVLAEALGMRVLFHDIVDKQTLGNAQPTTDLTSLLEHSDFVTLHVPDTPETRGMIGTRELGNMRAGSYLINASRGKVVDIEALRQVLVDGHLAGAAIDVYPAEPARGGDAFTTPLQGLDNVILTPHIGGSTQEAQANIGREVASSVVRYLRTGRTIGCVSLPQLDAGSASASGQTACRIVNLHRNVPGVLSEINRVVAQSDVNIIGQSLGTLADVGLLFIDIPLRAEDDQARKLKAAISELETSVRTRLLGL